MLAVYVCFKYSVAKNFSNDQHDNVQCRGISHSGIQEIPSKMTVHFFQSELLGPVSQTMYSLRPVICSGFCQIFELTLKL